MDATTALRGSCHCGAVQVAVERAPAELNDCQCDHCQRRGALWAYYKKSEVEVSGQTTHYVWGDRELEFHFCPSCGCSTFWWPIDESRERVGINARVFGKSVTQHTPIRKGPGPA